MRHSNSIRKALTLALSSSAGTLWFSSATFAAATQVGPAVVLAGPVAVTPTVGVETQYRDNIYLQENDTTSSLIYIARPAATAALQDRENRYEIGYKGEAGWYQENGNDDKNDYFDSTFSGDAHVELSERQKVEAYVRWAALHEDRGTGLTEGLVGEFISKPVKYNQSDVGGSYQLGTSEAGRLLLEAGYMDREYQNFEEITRTRDRDETALAATFFYPVAPKTDFLAETTYKDIHYPNPFEAGPPLDSDEYALLVGAKWEVTPNLTSTAKIGYVDKSFDDSARQNWDGVGWSVDVWMSPRVHDTIQLRTRHAPEETTRQGNFINREVYSATWTHDWSDRVYTELGALYGRDKYEQSIDDREDDIYNVSTRVGYEFRRWAKVYSSYSYDKKDSNTQNLSYTDHVFRIGIDFSL
jgi:hypothetical protein